MLAAGADIRLQPDLCIVSLNKKRSLPALLEALAKIPLQSITWLGDRRLAFNAATRIQTAFAANHRLGQVTDRENLTCAATAAALPI